MDHQNILGHRYRMDYVSELYSMSFVHKHQGMGLYISVGYKQDYPGTLNLMYTLVYIQCMGSLAVQGGKSRKQLDSSLDNQH